MNGTTVCWHESDQLTLENYVEGLRHHIKPWLTMIRCLSPLCPDSLIFVLSTDNNPMPCISILNILKTTQIVLLSEVSALFSQASPILVLLLVLHPLLLPGQANVHDPEQLPQLR